MVRRVERLRQRPRRASAAAPSGRFGSGGRPAPAAATAGRSSSADGSARLAPSPAGRVARRPHRARTSDVDRPVTARARRPPLAPTTCTASGSRRSRASRRTAGWPSSRSRPSRRRRTATATRLGRSTADGAIRRAASAHDRRRSTTGRRASRRTAGRWRSCRTDASVEEEPTPATPKTARTAQQVHLLPLDGGEARRLTDLPRGVDGFEWSPDGRAGSSCRARPAARPAPRTTGSRGTTADAEARRRRRESDYHFVDRLGYLFNGAGFIYHAIAQLWLVDAATGEARPLTSRAGRGRRAGLVARRPPDRLRDEPPPRPRPRAALASRRARRRGRPAATRLTGDAAILVAARPGCPDGTAVAALGGYLPENFYRTDSG